MVKKPFAQFVRQTIVALNEKAAVKGNLNIDMDPEVFAAYQASTAVSTSKGIGANSKFPWNLACSYTD